MFLSYCKKCLTIGLIESKLFNKLLTKQIIININSKFFTQKKSLFQMNLISIQKINY